MRLARQHSRLRYRAPPRAKPGILDAVPTKSGYGNLRLIAVTNSGSPFFAAALPS